jgi:trk system potassium uptake protein TrkA
MDIDVVINKKIVTASKIFSFTMADEVSSVKCLTCSDAEILEYVAKPDSKITSGPIGNVGFPAEAVIGGIVRGNVTIIPNNDMQIKPFDKVIVFALPAVIGQVGKFFNAQNRFF